MDAPRTDGRSGPAWWWFLVGGLMIAGSLVVGISTIVLSVVRALDRVDDFPRVPVPGTGQVVLERASSYTIYYEAPGVAAFEDDPAEVRVPPLRVSISQGGGDSLPLRDYGGSFNYSLSGHEGVALYTFRAPSPGRYDVRVEAALPPGTGQLAIGTSIARGLVGRAVIVGILCFLLFAGGVTLVIVTAIRRYQARRAA